MGRRLPFPSFFPFAAESPQRGKCPRLTRAPAPLALPNPSTLDDRIDPPVARAGHHDKASLDAIGDDLPRHRS